MIGRVRMFLHKHVVIQAIHAVAWILSAFAIGIGVSLIVAVPEIVQVPTFSFTFEFAAPHIWGIGFVIIGAWIGVSLGKNPASAPLPLSALGVLTGTWGLFTLPSVVGSIGAITAVWAYSALAGVCLVASASISHQENA